VAEGRLLGTLVTGVPLWKLPALPAALG